MSCLDLSCFAIACADKRRSETFQHGTKQAIAPRNLNVYGTQQKSNRQDTTM